MTWLDGVLIAVLALFLAVGARMGSLWTAACLAGGFLGAVLSDTYALAVAGWIGTFPGADWLAAAILFAGGVLALLIPGWILSNISRGFILGVVDSFCGLLTGGVAGILAVAVLLLAVVPFVPSVESSRAWRESALVQPLHMTFENLIGPGARRSLSKPPKINLARIEQRLRSGVNKAVSSATERIKG